jgi:two-component system, response regulator, stage 0 sporulation protein F
MTDKSFCIVNEAEEGILGTLLNVPPKILVADDDEKIRDSIVELIHIEGWEVIEAVDGRDALSKVVREKPDLLILDNWMPELTGVEVFKELRRLKIQVPVILITAAADITSLADKLGIKCYLGKPFGIDELLDSIHNALEGNCN